MATKIKLHDIYVLLSKQHNKKTMYIEFLKRSDGTLRKMAFQMAGSKKDNGDPLPIHRVLSDVQHETLTIWDLNKEQYRRLNLRDVQRLVIDQEEYDVLP
jgi:hypothetical protein